MSARRKERDYVVGYGRPPAEHQFKKGVSGNRRGRPKGRRRDTSGVDIRRAFSNAANQSVEITIDGRRVRMPRMEAMCHQLMTQGLKGNTRAAALFLKEFRTVHDKPEPGLCHEDWLELLEQEKQSPLTIVRKIVRPGDPE